MLGNPEAIGPANEPPYPCIVLTDPPGSDLGLRHLVAPLLQVEALGDPDGSPGKPALRRLLYTVLEELKALPDQRFGPGETVVTEVESSAGGGWSPLPTGQPRYLATVRLYMHAQPQPL